MPYRYVNYYKFDEYILFTLTYILGVPLPFYLLKNKYEYAVILVWILVHLGYINHMIPNYENVKNKLKC